MAQVGRRPAQQARSRETQAKIVAAARQALAGDGWEGLTVARVAGDAGVSVGSVYERFGDKDGLVRAVQHDVLDQVDAELRTAFRSLAEEAAGLGGAELVGRAVLALGSSVLRHGDVMGPLILQAASQHSMRERGNATTALAEELFTSLLLDCTGHFAVPNPQDAVPVLFRTVFSTAMWQVMFGQETGLRHQPPLEELVQEIIALARAYLGATI